MPRKHVIPCHLTEYGFQQGAALVERMTNNPATGATVTSITTPKGAIQVYVTRTGKIRVFQPGKGEVKLN